MIGPATSMTATGQHVALDDTATRPPHRTRERLRRIRGERRAGLLFAAPAVVVMVIFLIGPIFMAAWVSLLDWNGQSSPFTGDFEFVGGENYQRLLGEDGLLRSDFMISIRNTFYFMAFSVVGVTVLSFVLALAVNSRIVKGRGFFRLVFYFPSITSSVAISVVFLFLFASSGVVNAMLAWFGIEGPKWFNDPSGVVHLLLGAVGVDSAPSWLADNTVGGLSVWEWLAGPSVAMCALIFLSIWTSSGAFMLFFLVGLQNIPVELEEATTIDGATKRQRFWYLTLPMMRRMIVLVITLALIGSWQVFDQIFIITQGSPVKTTLTPAYISYQRSFSDGQFGVGAAVAFVLAAIIILLTLAQRWIGRERS